MRLEIAMPRVACGQFELFSSAAATAAAVSCINFANEHQVMREISIRWKMMLVEGNK